jgi:hypothetical protein
MITNWAWLVWISLAFFLTWGPLSEYLHVFSERTPARFAPLVPIVPIALAGWTCAVHFARRRIPAWADSIILAGPAVLLAAWKTPIPFALGVVLLLSAYGFGAILWRRPTEEVLARMGLRWAIGFTVLIWALIAFGIAGLLHPGPLAMLMLPALYVKPLWSDLRLLARHWDSADQRQSAAVSLHVAFGAVLAILGAIWSITPTIAFDPLKMHLPSARWYAETGVFQPLPVQPESYYPQGMELLMAFLWSYGGQAAAQLAAPVIVVPTLVLSAAILRRFRLGAAATAVGLVAAFSLPFLHWTAFVAKNDFPLVLFLLAALLALLERKPLAASLFLAMAFHIKHVALFGAVGLAPLFAWEVWKSQKRWRLLLAVPAVFLAVGTFSLIRTWAHTGNPLYPESIKRTTDISVVTHPYRSLGERVMRYVGIPWLLHFDGQRAFESSSKNPMGVWLVFFGPGVLLLPWFRSRPFRLVAIFCCFYLLYWVSILVTLRYAIAPILLLSALAAPALLRLPRWIGLPSAFTSLLFSFQVISLIELSAPQLEWLLGERNRDSYLLAALPSYGVLHHFRQAGIQEPIFAVGNCARAYAPRPDRFSCAFRVDLKNSDDNILKEVQGGAVRYLLIEQTDENAGLPKRLPSARLVYSDTFFAAFDLRPAPATEPLRGIE